MIRIKLSIALDDLVDPQGADFVFNIHTTRTARQAVVEEQLPVSQSIDIGVHTGIPAAATAACARGPTAASCSCVMRPPST